MWESNLSLLPQTQACDANWANIHWVFKSTQPLFSKDEIWMKEIKSFGCYLKNTINNGEFGPRWRDRLGFFVTS